LAQDPNDSINAPVPTCVAPVFDWLPTVADHARRNVSSRPTAAAGDRQLCGSSMRECTIEASYILVTLGHAEIVCSS
jgi:hypothetical protein